MFENDVFKKLRLCFDANEQIAVFDRRVKDETRNDV